MLWRIGAQRKTQKHMHARASHFFIEFELVLLAIIARFLLQLEDQLVAVGERCTTIALTIYTAAPIV